MKKNQAKQVLIEMNGLARTADFLEAGLNKMDVQSLYREGYLERIRHGYYQLAEAENLSEEQLLATLIPEAVVCVESALFYYGYSDFTPRKWSIAVPRNISRSKVRTKIIPFKAYYVPVDFYEIGKTKALINGFKLSIYDRERTLCDCFKYQTKLDRELFNKAVHAYTADHKKDLSNLSQYAKQMGLFGKVNALMEVLLNG